MPCAALVPEEVRAVLGERGAGLSLVCEQLGVEREHREEVCADPKAQRGPPAGARIDPAAGGARPSFAGGAEPVRAFALAGRVAPSLQGHGLRGRCLTLTRKVSGVMKPPCAGVYQPSGVVDVMPASVYFSWSSPPTSSRASRPQTSKPSSRPSSTRDGVLGHCPQRRPLSTTCARRRLGQSPRAPDLRALGRMPVVSRRRTNAASCRSRSRSSPCLDLLLVSRRR